MGSWQVLTLWVSGPVCKGNEAGRFYPAAVFCNPSWLGLCINILIGIIFINCFSRHGWPSAITFVCHMSSLYRTVGTIVCRCSGLVRPVDWMDRVSPTASLAQVRTVVECCRSLDPFGIRVTRILFSAITCCYPWLKHDLIGAVLPVNRGTVNVFNSSSRLRRVNVKKEKYHEFSLL